MAISVRPGSDMPMFRRRPVQPSRRAVLHVQAPGDPPVPLGLDRWFTERAFHFCVAAVRPGRSALPVRAGRRRPRSAIADLDAACTQLRQADGMSQVIVTAQGRGAIEAARWADCRRSGSQACAEATPARADAMILCEPARPAGLALRSDIDCPVLVVGGQSASFRLGSHVTWLQLPDPGGRAFFDAIGRWLGAYMYLQDQVLLPAGSVAPAGNPKPRLTRATRSRVRRRR